MRRLGKRKSGRPLARRGNLRIVGEERGEVVGHRYRAIDHCAPRPAEDVEDRVRPDTPAIPTCQIPVVDLGVYDLCLEGSPS